MRLNAQHAVHRPDREEIHNKACYDHVDAAGRRGGSIGYDELRSWTIDLSGRSGDERARRPLLQTTRQPWTWIGSYANARPGR